MSLLDTLSYIARGPFNGVVDAAMDQHGAQKADALYAMLNPRPRGGGSLDDDPANDEPHPALKSANKIADAAYDHLDVLSGDEGTNPLGSPDAWKSKSWSQKVATLSAFMQKQRMDAAKTDQNMAMQRLRDYGQQVKVQEQNQRDDATAGSFLQHYLTAPNVVMDEDGVAQPATAQDRLRLAAQKTPNMSGRVLPKVLDSLAKWQQATAATTDTEDLTTDEFTASTGQHFVTRGRQILPAGSEQPTEPIYSPDGKMFWNGRQWAELKQLGYPDGTTIQTINGVNALVDGNGRILKTLGTQSAGQALAGALNPGTNSAAPAKPASVQEVTRITKDGRKAVFDASTKKFLRYAN